MGVSTLLQKSSTTQYLKGALLIECLQKGSQVKFFAAPGRSSTVALLENPSRTLSGSPLKGSKLRSLALRINQLDACLSQAQHSPTHSFMEDFKKIQSERLTGLPPRKELKKKNIGRPVVKNSQVAVTEKPGLLTILANGSLQVFKYFCKIYLLTWCLTIEIFQYSAFPAEAWRSDTHDLHIRYQTSVYRPYDQQQHDQYHCGV